MMAKDLTLSDINAMKRDELREVLKGVLFTKVDDSSNNAGDSATLKVMMSMLTSITNEIDELKQANCSLTNEVSGLKEKVGELKKTNEDVITKLNEKDSDASASGASASKALFADVTAGRKKQEELADVINKSVRLAFDDEKHHREVIMYKIKEEGKDDSVISGICAKLQSTRPTEVIRLGKKPAGDKPRLLKVTFPTAFDSRAFGSRFDEVRSTDNTLSNVKVRPGRSKAEHGKFKEGADLAYKLNSEAKERKETKMSYSVRNNGVVWKFVINDTQKWVRDPEWKAPVTEN